MTTSDLSDIIQALVRFVLVLSAMLKFYHSGISGRRSYDKAAATSWDWRRGDAVIALFGLLQMYGVAYLLIRVFDAPLATMDILRAFITPTTVVSNILLTIHFLNGQVNQLIARAVEVVKCRLTRI